MHSRFTLAPAIAVAILAVACGGGDKAPSLAAAPSTTAPSGTAVPGSTGSPASGAAASKTTATTALTTKATTAATSAPTVTAKATTAATPRTATATAPAALDGCRFITTAEVSRFLGEAPTRVQGEVVTRTFSPRECDYSVRLAPGMSLSTRYDSAGTEAAWEGYNRPNFSPAAVAGLGDKAVLVSSGHTLVIVKNGSMLVIQFGLFDVPDAQHGDLLKQLGAIAAARM